jgi:hypothetical protein
MSGNAGTGDSNRNRNRNRNIIGERALELVGNNNNAYNMPFYNEFNYTQPFENMSHNNAPLLTSGNEFLHEYVQPPVEQIHPPVMAFSLPAAAAAAPASSFQPPPLPPRRYSAKQYRQQRLANKTKTPKKSRNFWKIKTYKHTADPLMRVYHNLNEYGNTPSKTGANKLKLRRNTRRNSPLIPRNAKKSKNLILPRA